MNSGSDQGFISAFDLERREAGLKAQKAQLDQALAQAGVQGNQAAYASLAATAAGTVTGVDADVGTVLAAGLTHELHVFVAPVLLGPRGRPGAVDWAGPENPSEAPRIDPAHWELCGTDAYVWGPLALPKKPRPPKAPQKTED